MTPDHPQKITFGDEMRSSGVRDVLVYCRDTDIRNADDNETMPWCGRTFPQGRMGAG
jgi:hypothetical protein